MDVHLLHDIRQRKMTIKRVVPPNLIERLAEASLRDLPRLSQPKFLRYLETNKKPVRLVNPIEVWSIGLESMIGEASLSDATTIAWRFLVVCRGRAVASTEVAFDRDSGQPHWSHFSFDPRIPTHQAAIHRNSAKFRSRKISYDMRFLRIPALDLNALLWFKPNGKGEDVIIPMASIALLRPGWPYSVQKLFSKVEAEARRRLAVAALPTSGKEIRRDRRRSVSKKS